MLIQSLKYIVEIEKTGSINKAAQNLFISQPHLSRILKEVESETNTIIFQRSRKGVELTHEGQKFMEGVHRLLDEYNSLESSFFLSKTHRAVTLKIATQRYSPIVQAFLDFYNQYCGQMDYVNLALYEDTMENIVRLVNEQIYNVGIVHILLEEEDELLAMLRAKKLAYEFMDDSQVYVQVNKDHPLTKLKQVRQDDLLQYPHATFADENVANINYCCDVRQYNQSELKKRIIIQDRGTLHSVIAHTDAYHLGVDVSSAKDVIPANLVYLPLVDANRRIRTYWIYMEGQAMNEYEAALLNIYRQSIAGDKAKTQ